MTQDTALFGELKLEDGSIVLGAFYHAADVLLMLQNSDPPVDRSALVALIQQWRQIAAITDAHHVTIGVGWHHCADELEAELARLKGPDHGGGTQA